LLSLKDMDRSDALAELIRAGISSFKIEGRLKDMAYVKNVTAHYRGRLDAILEEKPEYQRASSGSTRFFFTPDPAKTFNRGGTDYFLFGEDRGPVHSFDTPKSMGERLGRVKKATADWFTLEGDKVHIHNGDGLCFLDAAGRLKGFQVNRIDEAGRIFPPGRQPVKHMGLNKGTILHRNHDRAFIRLISGDTAERRIGLDMVFLETGNGFILRAEDEDGNRAEAELDIPKEPAKNEDRAYSVIEKQIKKLGTTPFHCRSFTIDSAPYFLAAKVLNGLRRQLTDAMMRQRLAAYERIPALPRPLPYPYPEQSLDFRLNVTNRLAEAFYAERGVKAVPSAYEIFDPRESGTAVTVMTTKHCIRRSLGLCTKAHSGDGPQAFPKKEWGGPLFLENNKGRFQVIFNCRNCEMEIRSSSSPGTGPNGL
ncbi:MAG: U32 family peptidase, partial [Desulfobacterales bacterium]|nr:U32 family peptidase [Desulfobacterales bacterium]